MAKSERKERLVLHPESCKGCGYCVRACPKKAVSLTGDINSKGYTTARVDEAVCTRCGACYEACPDYVFELLGEGA
jgi:2-oxoglutarate ferredoxin oxidoreductase subunit delta